jgi:ribosomal protein S18 acetylase RimI-like enzyme
MLDPQNNLVTVDRPLFDPLNATKRLHLRIATYADIPAMRTLLNAAYKELSDKGLNYTATFQDEHTTYQRVNEGRAFVLLDDHQIIGTILFTIKNHKTGLNTAYISQFAIDPLHKKMGLGSQLMDYCENLAEAEGFDGVQLDTAIPADHLVQWYQRRGYNIVDKVHWDGKTYDSYVLEKIFPASRQIL